MSARNAKRSCLPAIVVSLVCVAALGPGCSTPPPPAGEPFPLPPANAVMPPAAPAPTPTLAGPLTMDMAIERALASSEEVAALRAAVAVAVERQRSAADIADPELRLSYAEDTLDSTRRRRTEQPPQGVTDLQAGSATDEGSVYQAGLRFFPPNPWILPARLSEADASLRAAQADLAQAEWVMALDVRRLVAELLYFKKDLGVLDQLAAQSRQVLDIVRLRSEQGEATLADAMTASRRHLQSLSNRDRVRRRYAEQKRLLASLVDVAADSLELDPAGAVLIVSNVTAVTAADLDQTAMRHRADLAALYWRSAMAQSLYRQARAEGIPWFKMIQASYSGNRETSSGTDTSIETAGSRPSRTYSDDTRDGDEWQLDAAINVPLFSWMNHNDDVRRAEFEMARIREAQALKKLRRELRDALEALRDVQQQWTVYLKETDPLVREMQKTLDELKDDAQLTPDEAADIRIQILEAQRARLQATYEFTLAVINFEEVAGTRFSRGRDPRPPAPGGAATVPTGSAP